MKSFLRNSFVLAIFCTSAVQAQEFRELNWLELLPESDRIALLSQPAIQHGANPNEDSRPTLGGNLGANASSDLEATQTWQSTNIVPKFDKQNVRLPGFVVPLEFDGAQNVTEFFLVPYFGACIHVPPPPPNQLVHVTIKGGVPIDSLYDAIVVTGVIKTQTWSGEIAQVGYQMQAVGVAPFEL